MLGLFGSTGLVFTLIVMGGLILLARVYGGLHYVSDVVAGLFLGYLLASGFLSIVL